MDVIFPKALTEVGLEGSDLEADLCLQGAGVLHPCHYSKARITSIYRLHCVIKMSSFAYPYQEGLSWFKGSVSHQGPKSYQLPLQSLPREQRPPARHDNGRLSTHFKGSRPGGCPNLQPPATELTPQGAQD